LNSRQGPRQQWVISTPAYRDAGPSARSQPINDWSGFRFRHFIVRGRQKIRAAVRQQISFAPIASIPMFAALMSPPTSSVTNPPVRETEHAPGQAIFSFVRHAPFAHLPRRVELCCLVNTGVMLPNTTLLTQCSIVRSIRRIQTGVRMLSVVVGQPMGFPTAIAAAICSVGGLFTGPISGVAERALFRARSD